MANKSEIEWTEQTWNPSTGCTKISEGCKYCYAEVMARRLQAMEVSGYQDGFKLSLHPARLSQPLMRKKPTMYFVNSMSDLFHEEVPAAFVDQVIDVVSRTPRHTYQLLTKRAGRMFEYFSVKNLPDNLWLGVTVENRAEGLPRIDFLRAIQAKVRFVSVEPLLEDLGPADFSGIHWVIVGGESGKKARPMQEQWVQNVRARAEIFRCAFFFKQWGTWGKDGIKRNKKANGRTLGSRTYDAYPTHAAV